MDGPLPHGPGGWLTLLWVSALGLLAVVPLGAAIGAVLPNPREALALIMLPAMALLLTSGAMFPLTALPALVQKIASVFPLKWMAQGLRSALLPDAARAAEAAGSWELPDGGPDTHRLGGPRLPPRGPPPPPRRPPRVRLPPLRAPPQGGTERGPGA